MSFFRQFFASRWGWFIAGLPSWERASAFFHARRYTMTSAKRCRALWRICEEAITDKVVGSFVECGVWRGGSAGLMGKVIQNRAAGRDLHLFDSFQGLPEPTPIDGSDASVYSGDRASGQLAPIGQCVADYQSVRNYLTEELGLPATMIHFHVGWFQDTVPKDSTTLGPIAVLRLDGDWYESTRICLEHLYPLISPGGIVILDDYYYWEGCSKATDEYRVQMHIDAPLKRIDATACYWKKP
jgi:O-methyltransferase